jgi:hypothetical protein
LEGWWEVLRRNGINDVRSMVIRAAVVAFAQNFEKSVSRIRNAFQSGSLEVGCGIVMPVSAVDCEAFSVPAESTEEEVWEELRGAEDEATLLRESLSRSTAKLSSFAAVAAADESLAADLALKGVLTAPMLPLVLLSSVEVKDGRDDVLLEEKTAWGFCLNRVR